MTSATQLKAMALSRDSSSTLGKPEVSGAKEAVATFEGAEGARHHGSNATDQAIGGLFGEGEFPIPCGLVHDAVREAPDRKHVPVQLAAVPLVRVDTLASSRTDFIQHGGEFFRV